MVADELSGVLKGAVEKMQYKTVLTVFFGARGVIHHKFILQEGMVNQVCYISLHHVHGALWHDRPHLWTSGQ